MGSICREATPLGFLLASDDESIRQAAVEALVGRRPTTLGSAAEDLNKSAVLTADNTTAHGMPLRTPEVFWTQGGVSVEKTSGGNPGTELSGMVDMILLR